MKKRILLVEDNIADARLIREMLHEAGSDRYVLETAGQLSEAITLIREAPFDIVLLDLGLPDSQGLETLAAYLESAAETPVIVLTGLADDAISVQAVESGAQDYLVKGRIDGPMLSRAVRYAIGRKRQEGALRQSEERYRAVTHSATDAIVSADSAGNIVHWNHGAETIFGYSEVEVIGQPATLLIPSRFHEEHVAGMARMRAGGEPHIIGKIMELLGLRKNGSEFPIELSLAVWQAADGRYYTAIIRDISDRKRAEEETRVQAKFPSENPDPVMRIAMDGTLLYINNSGSRKLSEWNLQAGNIVPPMIRDAASRALNHGSRQIIDLEHNERVYSFTVTPISDAGYTNLYGRDITEHKRAEQTQMRLVAMLDATPGFVGFADAKDTHILYINSAGRKMVGIQAQEDVTRLKIADVHPEWTNKLFRDEIIPSALRDGMWTGECAFLDRDGREIPVMMVLLAHKSPSGEVERFSTISVDITDRKRAEIEKEKLQAQLQQAMKMEAVGRLAGGVAHDFNNLLTVITGYSELLLQKIGKESPMHGEVEEIQRAGERAASLTHQLLAFSRKQIIEPKVLHLDSLVAEIHKMLTRLIGEDIALQAITGGSLGSVKVDPGQFQQILMNLVVNARDAMPDGGKITIETANVDLDEGYCALHPYVKPGRFVMLAVSDTGKGMSEEVKAHIFEPFFTTKERGSGTGLGLATTYGAVKQAGGSIEVYSEVGIGTTIKIYLPRAEGEVVEPVKDDRRSNLSGGTETVLLVEDEDTLRTLCERILGDLGYRVLPAGDGAEAIALAKKYGDRVDLLLTDVVMPGMNGSELATQLVLHHPEMKVLFMSGYTDDAITRHGVLDEGVLFIGKPYTPLALARKVREVLDKA